MLWFTSDFHFGHKNISEYAHRPFPRGEAGVPAMDDGLVDAFNARVAAADDVWVLGDVALGRIDDSLARVGQLHGRKILVAGNHDRCWPGHGPRAAGWTDRYLAAGFAEVLPGSAQAGPAARLVLGGRRVLLSHFPYAGGGDSHGEDRFAQHRLPAGEDWLVCGHVHQSWRQRGRMINVGVDAWGGTPVPEAQLAELIEAGPQDRDILPWP
ncbi:MAG TPA: metallophosphoesterase family protein [Streptosporangiaceae bacterium]